MADKLNLTHYLAPLAGTYGDKSRLKGQEFCNVALWHPSFKAAFGRTTRTIDLDVADALAALLADAAKTGQALALAQRFAAVAEEVRKARKNIVRTRPTAAGTVPTVAGVSPFATAKPAPAATIPASRK